MLVTKTSLETLYFTLPSPIRWIDPPRRRGLHHLHIMFQTTNFPPTPPSELKFPASLTVELVSRLLEITHQHSSLTDRRQATLECLTSLLDARAGHWTWGYGDVIQSSVQPVAIFTYGYEPQDLAVISQMGLDSEIDQALRFPILNKMSEVAQSVDTRRCIFSDENWENATMRKYLLQIHADEWLHAVRYETLNSWSNMFFIRSLGQPPFEEEHRHLLDVSLSAIPWLRASTNMEPESSRKPIGKLTDRQRTVMLLLLDGQSRKQIASNLGITEETVGDHIKQIYVNFQVNSAVELAALFLRNR